MLGPLGRKTLNYQLHFDTRGYYQVGPLVLETGDLFGLHRRFRIVTEPVYIMVYPKVVPLPGYDLASRRPIGEIRLTHRLFEDPDADRRRALLPARRPAQSHQLGGDGAHRGRCIARSTTHRRSRARRSCSISTRAAIPHATSRAVPSWP